VRRRKLHPSSSSPVQTGRGCGRNGLRIGAPVPSDKLIIYKQIIANSYYRGIGSLSEASAPGSMGLE
jgi:hypothetical protein